MRIALAHGTEQEHKMLTTKAIKAKPIPITSPSIALPPFLIENLKNLKVTDLFPAQAEIIPFLARERFDFFILS